MLLLCITALPITPVLAFVKRWLFGALLCKLVPLCQGISGNYCLCFIAVDRYRSIVMPTREPWTTYHAYLLMAISWLTSATVSSPLFVTQRLQPLALENITLCGYVRADWIVAQHSMLTAAQQAQTAVRKRRVMYVLILMVVVFMASWLPLTIVNIFRDFGIEAFLDIQMYFKLLNVHAIAMTSIVWNPLLYFWMSKRHRKTFKEDMIGAGNYRRNNDLKLMKRLCGPRSPQPGNHLYDQSDRHYRRGTLTDPTCITAETAFAHMHANCFLLVPLLPLYQSSLNQKIQLTTRISRPT
ncbi:7 transmembrane receptor [Onchocerca flexuosa]|uniref:7 transmembrane receptor n=1 Tax=Onchocerca flexuosa TaxID=387005 RepID=A0A238BXG4_9BILA|nr:7 transmembrane receptor [Onchocerca flexuosa]